MTYIPQYATSTDPGVVAAIEANRAARKEFMEQALAFARKYGNHPKQSFQPGRMNYGGLRLIGIGGDKPTEHGQWASATKKGAWRPAKRNPILAEMEAISYDGIPVPGTSPEYLGGHRGWETVVLYPTFFVIDGTAWFRLSEAPSENQDSPFGGTLDTDLWTEALGSAWHAAYEEATA